jgi:hypothetical protein
MIPDFDLIPEREIFLITDRLVSYLALLLIAGVNLLTVSRLCDITSGRASIIC